MLEKLGKVFAMMFLLPLVSSYRALCRHRSCEAELKNALDEIEEYKQVVVGLKLMLLARPNKSSAVLAKGNRPKNQSTDWLIKEELGCGRTWRESAKSRFDN